jgi:hypothetical protein
MKLAQVGKGRRGTRLSFPRVYLARRARNPGIRDPSRGSSRTKVTRTVLPRIKEKLVLIRHPKP